MNSTYWVEHEVEFLFQRQCYNFVHTVIGDITKTPNDSFQESYTSPMDDSSSRILNSRIASSTLIDRPHYLFSHLSLCVLVVWLDFYAAYCKCTEKKFDNLI